MITREDLRRDGADLRKRLFGVEAGTHFVPNYADLRAELAFGVVWSRPGLALPDRMIAALAALCSVQRLNHLRRHIVAALDLGLAARSIVEVFIQCGIYAGFPASEDAMAVAKTVYAERGIELAPEPARSDPIETPTVAAARCSKRCMEIAAIRVTRRQTTSRPRRSTRWRSSTATGRFGIDRAWIGGSAPSSRSPRSRP
jgi:alkylhydroperoxidase/carboxymuconolactone decarboxylase family protein YurZ